MTPGRGWQTSRWRLRWPRRYATQHIQPPGGASPPPAELPRPNPAMNQGASRDHNNTTPQGRTSSGGRSFDNFRLARIHGRSLAGRHRRPRLHPAELHPVHRGRGVPARRHPADQRNLEPDHRDVPGRAGTRRLRRRPHYPVDHHVAPARLHRPAERADRRTADRRAAQARHHAQRRLADGRGRAAHLRLPARSDGEGDLHQVPQDAQPGRVRRLPAERPRRPALARHHRPAGRLRPRPDHRRLPPRRPVRGRRADRRQEGRPRGT